MKEQEKKWTGAEVECSLCGHIWHTVYKLEVKELECPKCNNMTIFNVIKFLEIKKM